MRKLLLLSTAAPLFISLNTLAIGGAVHAWHRPKACRLRRPPDR